MNPLVVVVGPTAVGKSALALELAERLGGEIVSADSRQVYRYMDIGTAKATPAEQARVRHHLIDVVDPDEEFNVSFFQRLAYAAIDDILQRGRLPLLVGGTGLWVRAVVEGLRLPQVPPQFELRRELEARAASLGPADLHRALAAVDPQAAASIDPQNVRRVVRALEVYHATGQPISQLQQRQPPPYQTLTIGLKVDRAELYRRIDVRVEDQVRRGLVEETSRLHAQGYRWRLPSMSGLGYRQLGYYLRGEAHWPEALQILKYDTHRFARQQFTWFRPQDPAIHWLEADAEASPLAANLVAGFLEGKAI